MNGYDVYKTAMTLLGYTDANGDISGQDGLVKRALDAINQIGADLCRMESLTALTGEITLSVGAAEAMPYGVAMLLALSDGDGGRNQLFCELYNAKRAIAKAQNGRIRDALPVSGGV